MGTVNGGTDVGGRRTFGPAGLRRRSELMDAAVRLAARNGSSATRVSDIVGRVGVGQGSFYWYFESKDALFREIAGDGRRRLRHYQRGWMAGEPDAVRRVAKAIVATVDFIAHNGHVFAFLDHASRDPALRGDRDTRWLHVLDIRAELESAMAAGDVRSGDAALLAYAVTGVAERIAWIALRRGGPKADIDGLAQEAVDLVLSGLTRESATDVTALRAEVAPSRELLNVRDRVGSLGPEPSRDPEPEPGRVR